MMKKLLGIVVLGLSWPSTVLANIYLYELGLGGAGSGIGGAFILLLIFYGAFFGSKLAKAIIWGWIMFFVTFGYCMTLFSDPELDFTGLAISFLAACAVLAFFTYLAEREKKKEDEELQLRFKSYNKSIVKKKRKKKKTKNKL